MAELPNISPEDVEDLIDGATDVSEIGLGGQKLVFKATIAGQAYAIKFAKIPPEATDETEIEEFDRTEVAIRAKREVETMRQIDSPHVVKLGPVGLEFATVGNQDILFFSEELVEGKDLKSILTDNGPFTADEVKRLAIQGTKAIKAISELGKVHRDIKPANIMRRDNDGDYLILDAGLAFDAAAESISVGPVGTLPYFSPEQFDFSNRRSLLDFRSDIFSLGATLYQLASGIHPFWTRGDTKSTVFNAITTHTPDSLDKVVDGFPEELSDVISRMLGKKPHTRYRRCDDLLEALDGE